MSKMVSLGSVVEKEMVPWFHHNCGTKKKSECPQGIEPQT